MRCNRITFLFFLVIAAKVFSQKGNYFIHNFLPSQYVASDQNRCVIQDMYGRILVANNDGILINKGTEWQAQTLPFLCLSLAKNENDEIFVAGDGSFGKLERDWNGEFRYDSLVGLLPAGERNLGRFWTIICLKGHVYFCSNQKILDYDYKKIKTILPGEEGFHTFFKVGDRLVVKERGKGLEYLAVTGEMQLFKGGEMFAGNDVPVRGIVGSESRYYIVSPAGMFEFKFNNTLPELSEITKMKTPADNWLNEKTVYCAAGIGKDHYAFGSVNGGLMITDRDFNPVKYINASNELQDDGVNYIYNDYGGHIWLALAKGVSLIEFNNPITRFTKSDGVNGTIEDCLNFDNTLFLATDKGMLRYNAGTLKFEKTNLDEVSWCLKNIKGNLFAGTKSGLYRYTKGEFLRELETESAVHCIYTEPDRSHEWNGTLVLLGTESGYVTLKGEGSKLVVTGENNEMGADIRSIESDEQGNVFFGSTFRGIFVLAPGKESLLQVSGAAFKPNEESFLFPFGKDILVFNNGRISRLVSTNQGFGVELHPAFKSLCEKYVLLNSHIRVKENLWLNFKPRGNLRVGEALMAVSQNGNEFEVSPSQLSRIKEADTKSFCMSDSTVYIGTNNGLYCYDLSLGNPNSVLNTFVNRVKFGKDSVLLLYNLNPHTPIEPVKLDFKNNSIELNPGASDFIDRNELLFSFYLEGLEDNFGPFTSKQAIKYDYLHEGDYVLHLRSRNILGKVGQEITIPFKVLPPWYRTLWAYILYLLVFSLLVYALVKLNSRRLVEQNLKLEKIIAERTREINKQKLEIEHKNQEITDSINYAKGIQDSILPSIDEVKSNWKDLFIYFQPKDIVSGDFYWYKSVSEHEFLIACCDCTGHGVPGGFMSMICSGKLHDAALESTEPDKILFLANNSIKESLGQQYELKSQRKDGMEICLLYVNTQTRKVKYSGANRPLWIYRNKTKQLEEIKPTKASIASSTSFNFSYDLSEIDLGTGDVLYASSDGYADQFGGSSGKKYMSKNFKAFLCEHAGKGMDDQHTLLKDNMKSWMRNFEQVDDLLVIGIRL